MRYRPNWTLLGLGALIIIGLFTYPRWRTLLNRRSTTSSSAYSDVSAAQQDILLQMRRTPNANPDVAYPFLLTSVPAPTSDAPTPDGAQMVAIASGDFVTLDAVHTATGHATLYRLNDGSAMARFDNFTVSNGPNLNVYLSKTANPLTAADLHGSDNSQFLLGPLKGTTGAQNYPSIPPDFQTLNQYKSVVIFSDSLQTVYSSAPLN